MPEQSSAPVSGDPSVQSIPVPPSPSPQAVKSSNEILTELFGAFNATPPPLDDITPQDSLSAVSEKSGKKHKKHSKKKHKKEKKRKRSSSSESKSSSATKKKTCKTKKKVSKRTHSETESADSKKKKKKKLGKFSASDTDSEEEEPKNKKIKSEKSNSTRNRPNKIKIKEEKKDDNASKKAGSSVSTVPISIQESILKHTVSRIVEKVIDSTRLASEDIKPKIIDTEIVNATLEISDGDSLQTFPAPIKLEPKCDLNRGSKQDSVEETRPAANLDPVFSTCDSSNLAPKPLPVADVFAEDLIDCGIKKDDLKNVIEKPKPAAGKITIKNLKFSQVYEATVKQIEEEAKLKAEKYEEGELSESSAEPGRSPSPESELSTSGSVDEVEVELEMKLAEKEKKHRHHHRKEKHRHHDRRRSRSEERHRSHPHRDRSGSCHNHKERSRRHSRERTKDRAKSKERVRSKERNRSRERHRSRERAKSKDRTRSKERSKEREKSKERMEREKSKDRERPRNERHRLGHRLRTRDKRNSEEKIDKQKLLEIARKNAMSMMKNSTGSGLEQTKVAITAGGKTVNELTDFCKLLSKKDADGHESISSNTSQSDDSESEKPFHHPFQIKDRPSGIVMNIRNSVALPVKSHQEKTAEQSRQLRLQFPVSSGQHHRKTESEWVPVSPKKAEASATPSNTQVAVVRPKRTFKDHPDPPAEVDIGSIVSARLSAMRRLQENPTDPEALTQIYRAQQNMQTWAESKQSPHDGQFTGSTGAKVLSQAELASGYQAWARRDQLQSAAPVNSGMGMTLLQKMGWRPGEGLGKNKEGTLQPLLLEVKMDKKGLVAQEELPVRQPHQVMRGPPRSHSLEGKHPVSLLNEYCSRRKYGPPIFDLVDEAGPDHKKNFLFKVRVNGVEYKPAVGSPKKKQARAEAAEVCLKALGVLSNR